MRLIHTSDWHLGQYFYTKNRAAEHQAFLRWLIVQIKQQQVNALIVAGDLFDTGSPPSFARELYNRFVAELRHTGCQLVVLGGNHDSVAMLNESRELFSCLNTTVIASAQTEIERQIVVLKQHDGQPAAIVCAIPFLRPRDLLTSRADESGTQKQRALQTAIAEYYEMLYRAACDRRKQLNLPLPIIATGHLTTVGVNASDSVRDIYIGTLNAFPVQAFPPADYIALGHIHSAQSVAKSAHIRYSGSPIPLSFDELSKAKSVFMVDFTTEGRLKQVTPLAIPCFQPMQLIKGDLQQIEQQLLQFANYQGDLPVWLDIEVTTQHYLSDIQCCIQQIAEALPVEVLLLRRSKEQRRQTIKQQDKETLNELSVNEVFERLLTQYPEMLEEQRQQMRQMFQQVVAQLQHLHQESNP